MRRHCGRGIGFLMLVVAFSGTLNGGPALAQTGWTWRTASPFPEARTEVSAATDGANIYVFGGFAAGRSSPSAPTTIYRYDVAADRWSAFAELPEGVNHAGAAIVGGRLYVIGGFHRNTFEPTAEVRILDLRTGMWRRGAPLPTARGALAVAVVGGRIHAVGGAVQGGVSVGLHDVYDPATDRWQRLAALPRPRNHLAAATLADRLYAIGGRDASSMRLTEASVYDAASDSWRALAALPTGRSGIGAAVLNGRIVVLGGETEERPARTFGEAEAYEPGCNCWDRLAAMPTPRHGLGVVAVGDRIFAIAGGPAPGFAYAAVNEVLAPAP
ncbi:MAG: kelch repeat-containing protein [Bauldia sp.]